MATLPAANVTIDDEAGAFGGGTGYAVVAACVATNADGVPRVYSSTKGILSQHGYSQGADYSALHFEETKQPIIFIGMPIATAGAIASQDATGVTGTSVVSAAAGSSGVLEEVDAIVTVKTAGTIGVAGIVLTISLDDGRSEKDIRLGTASSYVLPYVGVTLNFAAGTLIAGDVYRFRTTAPMWDSAGLAAARTALAAQQKLSRSWVIIGDLPSSTFAGYVTTQVNAYETSNDRYTYARASVKDSRLGRKSKLAAQSLTFAEVGATGDTITRTAGSWLDDGFKVGDTFDITGTASNNLVGAVIGAVTATVITLTTADLVAETLASNLVTMEATTTKAAYVALMDSAFASVDAQKRIDLSLGRARKQSPITGWLLRRPAAWAASIREYSHDIHIATWRKSDGPLDGWDLLDEDGTIEEFDQRVDGGALEARFTCFRTWPNGPNGAFIAQSLTRESDASLLSMTHNMAVANLACTVAQAETENAVGQSLVLDPSSGKGTESALTVIEERVNTGLEIALLQDRSEGKRASFARWEASRDDVLNVADAELNGTLVRVNTRVRIQTAG